MEHSTDCAYHAPQWWTKHPRAEQIEIKDAKPILDLIFWQTTDGLGLYRTFTYCAGMTEDAETQRQLTQLAISVSNALIEGMAKLGILQKCDKMSVH